MAATAGQRSTRAANDVAQFVVAILASVALVAVIWSVDYFPTDYGPQRLFQGHLLSHFADAGTSYSRYLEPGAPVSRLGFVVLFSGFERVMGWSAAYRAVICLTCLAWSWAFFWMARSLERERGWLGLFGFASALGWPLFMGFFSYALSLAVTFLVVGVATRRGPYDAKTRVILGALLTLQTLIHIFGAMVTGLVLLLFVLYGHAGKKRVREMGWLVLQSLPTLWVLFLFRDSYRGEADATWLPVLERLELVPRLLTGGPFWRAGPLVLLGAVGTCWGAARSLKEEASTAERALATATALLWVATITSPTSSAHWQHLAPLFLAPAALVGCALIPIEIAPPGAVRGVGIGALTLHCLGTIGWAGLFVRDVHQRLSGAWEGLSDHQRRRGPRLTMVLDPYAGLTSGARGRAWRGVALPYYAPLHHLGMIYAIEQGGIPAQRFANNPRIDSFVLSAQGRERLPAAFAYDTLRDPAVLGDREARLQLVTWLALMGRSYEDVLLYGEPRDVAELERRGYEPSIKSDKLFLGRFHGCSVTAVIAGITSKTVTISMEQGFGNQGLRPRPLDAGKATKGVLKIRIDKTLCGAGWLRIEEDTDGSGDASDEDRTCKTADSERRTSYLTNDGEVNVQCDLVAATR